MVAVEYVLLAVTGAEALYADLGHCGLGGGMRSWRGRLFRRRCYAPICRSRARA
jgi:K+ transporter